MMGIWNLREKRNFSHAYSASFASFFLRSRIWLAALQKHALPRSGTRICRNQFLDRENGAVSFDELHPHYVSQGIKGMPKSNMILFVVVGMSARKRSC
jgi:hypothetical protein